VAVSVLSDRGSLMHAAAARVVRCADEAIAAHGRFDWALAGGSTPEHLYRLLASSPYAERLRPERMHLFFGDERCVPANHPDSNYRMVAGSLLSGLPVPAANVHRMRGELPPEQAAEHYQAELERHFELQVEAGFPRFDLVLLGMGADGHTASLFPGTAALTETRRWVVANAVPALGTTRLTVTLPVLGAAAHVLFLVAGGDKAERVKEVLTDETTQRPAGRVRAAAAGREPEWLLDTAAAARLGSEP
jgi:6-phosphogluconolactonase